MTSTTYVARTALTVPATDTNTRTSGTMAYSHAVVGTKDGAAYTWHLTEAAARKAAQGRTGVTVVAVEAHQGGKATVLRRLAAETPAPVVVETPAAPVATGARTWDATTATSHVCAGACGQELPVTAYPTTGKPGQRGVVCRKDRDAARTARATA